MANLFLVASGGTGMRCLQSIIQMCSLGMFPGKTIHVLLLETDEENKDKRNTENLVKWYQQITSNPVDKNGKVNSNHSSVGAYFSAQIKLYTFVPDYSKESTRNFVVLSQVERGNSEINHKLANIFYEEGVQEFNLAHGYRAQAHLGAYLMYHAIIDEVRQAMSSDNYRNSSSLWKFINTVQTSTKDGARVFALGSTFGGTGASTIPVITRGITDSCKLLTDDKIQMDNIYYGAVVISDYFTFNPPSDAHKKEDKVIAQSEFFEHNSASALMYYVNDPTILATYKRLYLLGWGDFKKYNTDKYKEEFFRSKNNGKTATGGKNQTNPAHIIELFGAYAAKHFFDDKVTPLDTLKNIKTTEFRYKTLETEGAEIKEPEISFEDLYSIKDESIHEDVKKNFVGFVTLAAIVNQYYFQSISIFLDNLKQYNINYEFSETEKEALDSYLEYFYNIKADSSMASKFIPGWVRQLYLTFHGETGNPGTKFFGLSGDVFGKEPKNWFNNFTSFSKNEKKAIDLFIGKMLSLNKTGKSPSRLPQFMEHIRQAFSDFEIVNGLKKQVEEV
jgi:hypothetical protein